MRPLNILYLHSHDTGRYIQPYGCGVATPNLQRLAEQGLLFRQAFCAAPTCSPSRAALLTGQCPHSAGMMGLTHRGFTLRDNSQHLVHTLRKAGYVTALAGIQHEAREDATIGYDQLLTAGHSGSTEGVARQFLQSAPTQPFFLSVGFFETHRRDDGCFTGQVSESDARYVCPPAPLPDVPPIRQDMADFYASVGILDRKMGQVLDALDRAGLAENTLVICTTDHGIPFPAMKCNLTDQGMGVMLILRGPGSRGLSGEKTVDALVSQIDLFPTICELTGIAPPPHLQGRSLMPLIDGRAAEVNDEVFGEVTYHAAYEPMRAVRTRRYKYIRRFGERRRPVLPNCDDSLSKSAWLACGWKDRPVEAECLYDLMFDPHEMHNLAGETCQAPVLVEMRQRLKNWMTRTDDPLLKGPAPAPAGARVNDPDGLSPRVLSA